MSRHREVDEEITFLTDEPAHSFSFTSNDDSEWHRPIKCPVVITFARIRSDEPDALFL